MVQIQKLEDLWKTSLKKKNCFLPMSVFDLDDNGMCPPEPKP